jgi:hypothetical protein
VMLIISVMPLVERLRFSVKIFIFKAPLW